MNSERLGHSSSSRGSLSGPTDENSVVSLKALAARATPKLSSARASLLEDSGMIDLKKLMANAAPSSNALPSVFAPSDAGLFAVPEVTFVPHVAAVSGVSAKDSVGWAKWLGAATLVVLAGLGTLGILQARKAHVSDRQSGVSVAAAVATTEKLGFVEAPRPIDTAHEVTHVAPTAKETPAPVATAYRTRKAVVPTPPRNQAQQEATPPPEVEAQQPPPAPCDLMCEIERAAHKKP